MLDKQDKLLILTGLFTALMVVANVTAAKMTTIATVSFPAGTFAFALTFLVTDVIGEVWGRDVAQKTVKLGFLTSLIAMGLFAFTRYLPAAVFWNGQHAYEQILGSIPRITIAGLVTYLISQTFDVWIFDLCKTLTKNKFLWLRNNVSTILSQLLDTCLFILIAFGGSMPLSSLIQIAIAQYMFKTLLAIIDTPICYLLVHWAQGNFKKAKSELASQ